MLRMIAHCYVRTGSVRTQVERAFSDRRLAKVAPLIIAGGLPEAICRYTAEISPPLMIIEADDGNDLMEQIDSLSHVCDPGSNLIILGKTNDIEVYRTMLRHGVADYLVAPFDPARVAGAVLDLLAGPNREMVGRTIAFIGSKGGSGSSVVAHNTAFALTRITDCDAMVLDLDMQFGCADLDFNIETTSGMRNLLAEPERIDETFLQRFASKYDDRLQFMAAPTVLDAGSHIDTDKLEAAVEAVKRHCRFIVLDLPHSWSTWVQQSLRFADTVVLTTPLDLASLRNTRNLLDWLSDHGNPAPHLVVNGSGDRNGMIELSDFTKTLGIRPAIVIPEDRDTFRKAACIGKMVEETRPKSKAAQAIRQLAALLAMRDKATTKKAPPSPTLLSGLLKRVRRG